MNQVLTIVGASARAAASSAVRAGYCVCAADLFADADLCRVSDATQVGNYPTELRGVVAGPQQGAWMYTGALENHAALVDSLASRRRLWGNPGEVLRRVRNPRLVSEVLVRAGLHCPQVAFDPTSVPRDGRWLCKPRRSAGGAGIALWDHRSPAIARSPHRYFQQWIDGLACSAVYVAIRRRAVLLGVTRQLVGQAWTGTCGFRYCGSIGPITLPATATDEFARLGDVLAGEFELVGLFGVDAVVNSEGVWPVEVNPRYTASVEILERAGGLSAISLHAASCAGRDLPSVPKPAAESLSGKAIVFATAPLKISAAWCEAALARAGECPATLADIPGAGTVIQPGWPVATVLADAETEETVLDLLRDRATSVLETAGCEIGPVDRPSASESRAASG